MKNNITKRHLEILEILVSDYIASTQPVGSCTIAKKHYGHLSPATVRNIMADLTELGYIKQPHVSAGRVPTSQGMRLFVDTLLKCRELTDDEMKAIRERCLGNKDRMHAMLTRTSKILAAVSHYAGMVVTPDAGRVIFKQIEFMPLSRGRILGIFVSQDGMVQNKLLELNENLTYPEIERINNYCNQAFTNLSLEDALDKARRELEAERIDYDELLKKAMLLSHELMEDVPSADLVVEGEMHLLAEPEFAEAKNFQKVIAAIEEKRTMVHLLERCREARGVRIFVGADAKFEGVDSIGVVGAPYLKDGKVLGALGVIGPMRMDYSKVVPIVDFTAKVLSDMLDS
ncbi:MAG: heat-inducible transcriptional repressor HrcA [Pseudomonadota bacterium]